MKKTINGTRYDTDIMELIGEAGEVGDQTYWQAGLYVSPRSGGRYCLAGDGGPMSRFAQSWGRNVWGGGGSDLIPMTRAEARAWADQHLHPDVVKSHFGDA